MREALYILASLGLVASLSGSMAWADDQITPLDPATGIVLVAPQDSMLAEEAAAAPPNPKPPPYTLLRYTERYSYLADPSKRTDALDALKYIQLNPDNPESYLSFGGELRERFEHYNNQAFGVAGPRVNNYGLQRLMLHADLHVNERLRFFMQGISSVQFGGESKSAINQDPLDVQQAFVDYTFGDPTPNGERLTVRGGRFSMTYGSGRLVATRAAPNTPLKFDGIQVIGSRGGNTKLYGFLAHPVMEERYKADRPNYDQTFGGIYASFPIGGMFNLSTDLYYFGLRNEKARYADGSGIEDRHTVGMRFFGKWHQWDYDLEPVIQVGTFDDKTIRAWTIASDVGYTFSDINWTPRLGLKADIASGDQKKGDGTLGTFNPLFFKAGYFNDASVIRPSNIADIHLSVQMLPSESLTLVLGSDAIWRYSKHDAIYGTGGGISLPASSASSYVGTTAEASLQWKLNRHLVGTVSYVHMFTGNEVARSGGNDIDYLATWMSYIW